MESKDLAAPDQGAQKMERIMSAQWVLFGILSSVFYGYIGLDYDTDPDSCIAT